MIFTRILLINLLFGVTFYAQQPNISDNINKIKALSNKMEPREILRAMEIVADWQLNNPIRIDVIYKTDENKPNERVKILWDGTLLLKENREYEVKEGKYPDSWHIL
jgi:hypothetical protein